MLHILFGQDSFSLQEVLEAIKADLGNEELLASNTTMLDGQKLTLNQLMTTCDAAPFLAPKRLVIVSGLLTRFEPRSSGTRKRRRTANPDLASWHPLTEYTTTMPPSTVLVLVDSSVTKQNPLLKQLSSKATIREFPLLREARLRDWVWSRIKGRNGDISPGAVQVLAELIGSNLWVMASEIEKLSLYAHGRRIEEKDVRLLVSYAQESNVFAMVDAIINRRLSLATRLLHQLLEEGAATPYLLFMITRQFRMLMQARELDSQQVPTTELARRLGLASDYRLRKILAQARRYSIQRLEAIYHKLLEADVSVKTGKQDSQLALDLLVVELCQGKG